MDAFKCQTNIVAEALEALGKADYEHKRVLQENKLLTIRIERLCAEVAQLKEGVSAQRAEAETRRLEAYHAIEARKELETEVATLKRHLEHSERKWRSAPVAERPQPATNEVFKDLKAQISGLLWQVEDLDNERKVLRVQLTSAIEKLDLIRKAAK
jgi:chromosome segregation ATPase